MRMFGERIDVETPELHDEGVRMRFIGRREGVAAGPGRADGHGPKQRPPPTTASPSSSPSTTAAGRRSSTRREASRGSSEEEFRRHLYAPEMHDPDLLIRTSGEQRISNYLLWQCAYSELVFRDELWPDFSRAAFEESLREFEARRRRFGARASDGVGRRASTGDFERARSLRGRDGRPESAPQTSTPRPARAAQPLRGETARRVLVAIPWIAFAIAITVAGGLALHRWRWS